MNEQQKTPQAPEALSELIQKARSGDQAAYTALYEATHQEIYRTVRAQVRSEELALDIQQDAYVFAFTHLDQLGDPAKFRPWLRTIAVNRTRSMLRKQTPVLFTELETEEGDAVPELPDLSPENSPELKLERKETSRLLRDILDGLTAGQRMLVGLYYYEQQPVGKIAEDLGVSPGTVKTQLYRARKKIEAAVKRLEEKGVKLYGLSPLPFLLALLGRQEAAPEAGKAVLSGSLSQAGIVTESTALHVGRSFFQTALGRVWLGLLTVTVITGGVLGYRWIRDRANYGDVQPTETVERTELTTEPTEPVTTAPETSEPTDPIETTEPTDPIETTEPTDPAETTEPTDPAETTEPTDPANPGASASTEPKPTDATETDPGDEVQSTALISWGTDLRTMQSGVIEFKDAAPDSCSDLFLIVRGEDVPSLYSDNEAVAGAEYGNEKTQNQDGSVTYCWIVRHKGIGSANIYCRLNGASRKIAVVNNSEHMPALIEAEWFWLGSLIQSATIMVGESANFIAEFAWCENAELVADQPSKLSIRQVSIDQNGVWYETAFAWMVTPNSSGTYNLYLKMEGITVGTYQLVVWEQYGTEPTDPTPTDLTPEPTDPTPEPTDPTPEPTDPTPEPTEPDPETP